MLGKYNKRNVKETLKGFKMKRGARTQSRRWVPSQAVLRVLENFDALGSYQPCRGEGLSRNLGQWCIGKGIGQGNEHHWIWALSGNAQDFLENP